LVGLLPSSCSSQAMVLIHSAIEYLRPMIFSEVFTQKAPFAPASLGNPGGFGLAYRAEEQPREHPPMVGANVPNAPIAIALHDCALQAEGAAAATLAHHSHTLTVARPSAICLAVLRRPRAVDDLRDAPADVSQRTGFPPNAPSIRWHIAGLLRAVRAHPVPPIGFANGNLPGVSEP
jgi:hypothetical protein